MSEKLTQYIIDHPIICFVIIPIIAIFFGVAISFSIPFIIIEIIGICFMIIALFLMMQSNKKK